MEKRQKWNPLLCDYPNSEKINSVSIMAETLFTRLLAASDDRANYEGCPTLIMCGLFSKRYKNGQITGTEVEQIRDELVTSGLTTLYQVRNETYLHLNNCKKFLRKDIKPDIRYPDITEGVIIKGHTETVTNPLRDCNENAPSYSYSTTYSTTHKEPNDKNLPREIDNEINNPTKEIVIPECDTLEGKIAIQRRLGVKDEEICQILNLTTLPT